MLYFAYGSNMDAKRMQLRGVAFSKRVRAVLKGYRLEFNKVSSHNAREGFANIVRDENSQVEGVLYEISEDGLRKLDNYEGYPHHYNRIKVFVLLDDGSQVEAVAYIAQPDKTREGLKPSRAYLSHLLAAEDVLSPSYIEKLKSVRTLD